MLTFEPGQCLWMCGCGRRATSKPAAEHDDGSCYYPDACGICDGPGAIYECGCADIPEGDCDCNGNVLDECGVCGGSRAFPLQVTATAMAMCSMPAGCAAEREFRKGSVTAMAMSSMPAASAEERGDGCRWRRHLR